MPMALSVATCVSLTRTCTRTVSPGWRAGRFFLRSAASTSSIAFIGMSSVRTARGRQSLVRLRLDLPQQLVVLDGEGHVLQEVRPALARRAERLLAPPAADLPVVAGEQHVRHLAPADLGRPREVRVVQDPGGEGVLGRRALVPERAGQEAY